MLEEKLRDEIIETQRAQNDLTKWKLILVAGVGAAALKVIPGSNGPKEPLLLTLIPLVCMFVDTVCFHLGVRIMTIARFLRGRQLSDDATYDARSTQEYESYCQRNRQGFAMEGFALLSVTLSLSAAVFLLGFNPTFAEKLGLCKECTQIPALTIAGATGFVLSILFFAAYRRKTRFLDETLADKGWPEWGAFALWHNDIAARGVRRVLRRRASDWLTEFEKANTATITLDPAAFSDQEIAALVLRYVQLRGKSVISAPTGISIKLGGHDPRPSSPSEPQIQPTAPQP